MTLSPDEEKQSNKEKNEEAGVTQLAYQEESSSR
jgi:hypothetical protein